MVARAGARFSSILALGIASVMMTSPSFAQSGLEATKDLSGGNKASDELLEKNQDLLNKLKNNQLKNNGVDESTDETSSPPSAGQANLPNPYAAEGGPLKLMNCGGGAITVKTYNSNDTVLWVPYETKTIGNGASNGLKCNTNSCKLAVGSLKTGPLSGYQVYVGGKVRATNKAAMGAGCTVYN